jgi:hypothetical protein
MVIHNIIIVDIFVYHGPQLPFAVKQAEGLGISLFNHREHCTGIRKEITYCTKYGEKS